MEKTDNNCNEWAKDLLEQWSTTATSNTIIYTYGFVSSYPDPDGKKESRITTYSSIFLLFLLTIVSLIIQIVVPLAIVTTLPSPDGLCPNQAIVLTKIIGFTLCLLFVVLTISMCSNKLRGLGFLKLFCSHDEKVGWNRYFVDLGILSNLISMGASGIAQYLLFIRNSQKDYVLLLLQSLSMQFVLTVDEKLMTKSWTSWTKSRLLNLVNSEKEKNNDLEGDLDEVIMKRVKLMYAAESMFLLTVCVTGIGWSIGLAYCM